MVIVNHTDAYKFWAYPQTKTYLTIHLFNYTNVEEYELGTAEKLHVQEVGPYVYE